MQSTIFSNLSPIYNFNEASNDALANYTFNFEPNQQTQQDIQQQQQQQHNHEIHQHQSQLQSVQQQTHHIQQAHQPTFVSIEFKMRWIQKSGRASAHQWWVYCENSQSNILQLSIICDTFNFGPAANVVLLNNDLVGIVEQFSSNSDTLNGVIAHNGGWIAHSFATSSIKTHQPISSYLADNATLDIFGTTNQASKPQITYKISPNAATYSSKANITQFVGSCAAAQSSPVAQAEIQLQKFQDGFFQVHCSCNIGQHGKLQGNSEEFMLNNPRHKNKKSLAPFAIPEIKAMYLLARDAPGDQNLFKQLSQEFSLEKKQQVQLLATESFKHVLNKGKKRMLSPRKVRRANISHNENNNFKRRKLDTSIVKVEKPSAPALRTILFQRVRDNKLVQPNMLMVHLNQNTINQIFSLEELKQQMNQKLSVNNEAYPDHAAMHLFGLRSNTIIEIVDPIDIGSLLTTTEMPVILCADFAPSSTSLFSGSSGSGASTNNGNGCYSMFAPNDDVTPITSHPNQMHFDHSEECTISSLLQFAEKQKDEPVAITSTFTVCDGVDVREVYCPPTLKGLYAAIAEEFEKKVSDIQALFKVENDARLTNDKNVAHLAANTKVSIAWNSINATTTITATSKSIAPNVLAQLNVNAPTNNSSKKSKKRRKRSKRRR